MVDRHGAVVAKPQDGLLRVDVPAPRVAEPCRRQHVQRRSIRTDVGRPDHHHDVVGTGLCVVDLDHPVAVVVECAGVEELVLRLVLVAPGILGDEIAVGKGPLRIVVPPAIPRVTRQRIQIPPVVLGVLTVVALRTGQPEHPLLQDGVVAVPQRQPETEPLLDVGEPGHPVLPPPVGTRSGVIVGEVRPGIAVGAVVLTNRPPLTFAQIRPPPVPVARLEQAIGELAERRHTPTLRDLVGRSGIGHERQG